MGNRFGKAPEGAAMPETKSESKYPARVKAGAAWTNFTQKGEPYFRVKLTIDGKDMYYKMWTNGFKNKDSDPTHILYAEEVKTESTKVVTDKSDVPF